jgi:2'-5' RNA ligase
MLRLFAAVEIPPEIGEDLEPAQKGLEGARWKPVEGLHVTLRFFGEVQETAAADLDTELGRITGRPFDLEIQGAGSFGEGEKGRSGRGFPTASRCGGWRRNASRRRGGWDWSPRTGAISRT